MIKVIPLDKEELFFGDKAKYSYILNDIEVCEAHINAYDKIIGELKDLQRKLKSNFEEEKEFMLEQSIMDFNEKITSLQMDIQESEESRDLHKKKMALLERKIDLIIGGEYNGS